MLQEYIINNPTRIVTDSRKIKKGDVFLAIKGKNFDGHDFVKRAFSKGARGAIVSKDLNLPYGMSGKLIKTRDTLDFLGFIAKIHRSKFNIPVIAITGSNGKTTAKEMLAHILSSKFNVLKTRFSENNLIGIPLTLLKLTKKHDIAVIEVGTNHKGEIDHLCDILKPDIGVITNIGPSHLEFLNNLNNVFMAKSELLNNLPKNGLAVLNKDDIYLRKIKNTTFKRIYFGIKNKCEFQAKDLTYSNNRWHFTLGNSINFETSILGRHNTYNALLAIAIARVFKIDFKTIASRIKSFKNSCPMRLEPKKEKGIIIINDSYNSNPLSMKCALEALLSYESRGRRIVVSGDMLELGKDSRRMHENVGSVMAKGKVDALITLGEMSKFTEKRAKRLGLKKTYHAKTPNHAATILKSIIKKGDVVLVKGSRALKLEKVVEKF